MCLLSTIHCFLRAYYAIAGLKNVQDPEIVNVGTHTCRLRPLHFEQNWPVVRSSLVRPTWYHHPILEPRLSRLSDPRRWMEIFVHLSFPRNAQRHPSSGLEEVGARSEEGVGV